MADIIEQQQQHAKQNIIIAAPDVVPLAALLFMPSMIKRAMQAKAHMALKISDWSKEDLLAF